MHYLIINDETDIVHVFSPNKRVTVVLNRSPEASD